MLEVFKQLMSNTYAVKREAIRQNLIKYYLSLSNCDVMIPAMILANEDIKLIERNGQIDEFYRRLNCEVTK